MEGIKLIIFILGRGRGERLLRLCEKHDIAFSIILRGHGTAGTEIMSILGIGDPEKDVVLLSAAESRADAVMNDLAELMGLSAPGSGIAFTIPFSAAASQFMSYDLFAGTLDIGGEESGIKRFFKKLGAKKEER